jgi:flagellar protein FlaG
MVQEVSNRTDLLAAVTHASQNASQRPSERNAEEKIPEKAITEPQSAKREAKEREKELKEALSRVREVFHAADPRLEFSIDPDLDRVVVKVMNGDSGEVIRQIPQQEVIELAKSLETPTGLLLRHKV